MVYQKAQISYFADDTKIFRDISSIDDCNMLQQDLINLQKWSDVWLLFRGLKDQDYEDRI